MSYLVQRLNAFARTTVAGPFALQADADTVRASMTHNDPGVTYEVVQETGVGDGSAVDASQTAAAGGGDVTVATSLDLVAPDTSSDVTRDPAPTP